MFMVKNKINKNVYFESLLSDLHKEHQPAYISMWVMTKKKFMI